MNSRLEKHEVGLRRLKTSPRRRTLCLCRCSFNCRCKRGV